MLTLFKQTNGDGCLALALSGPREEQEQFANIVYNYGATNGALIDLGSWSYIVIDNERRLERCLRSAIITNLISKNGNKGENGFFEKAQKRTRKVLDSIKHLIFLKTSDNYLLKPHRILDSQYFESKWVED